ncbi:MAG: hypothetical protein Q7J32_17435 [Sphingomonadaceae bacterium]|nr:hypothetical protein [Sphingomonadaceae bacterium]
MASVESDRRAGRVGGPKRWQALVALAIGLAVAGLPTAAVPLTAGRPVTEGEEPAGAGAALVVEAVLRVTARGRPVDGGVVTS